MDQSLLVAIISCIIGYIIGSYYPLSIITKAKKAESINVYSSKQTMQRQQIEPREPVREVTYIYEDRISNNPPRREPLETKKEFKRKFKSDIGRELDLPEDIGEPQ